MFFERMQYVREKINESAHGRPVAGKGQALSSFCGKRVNKNGIAALRRWEG
jgi:hypothetical protein